MDWNNKYLSAVEELKGRIYSLEKDIESLKENLEEKDRENRRISN